jgi:hypothetical protein
MKYVTDLKMLKRVVIFTVPIHDFGSHDSLVGIASGYGFDGRGSIPGRVKKLFSTPQRKAGSGAHQASMGTMGSLPWSREAGV